MDARKPALCSAIITALITAQILWAFEHQADAQNHRFNANPSQRVPEDPSRQLPHSVPAGRAREVESPELTAMPRREPGLPRALAANDHSVFVLLGDTLYRFDGKTLVPGNTTKVSPFSPSAGSSLSTQNNDATGASRPSARPAGEGLAFRNRESDDLAISWSRGLAVGRGPVRFTHAPMRPEDISAITPMGLMVGAHVTPTSHQYYYPKDPQAGPYEYDVVAPAAGAVVMVQHRVKLDGSTESPREYDDYQITLEHSGTFYSCYDLITRLDPALLKAIGGDLPGGPPTYLRFPVKAGQRLGKIGGRSLDFAVINTEVTLKGLLVPEHYLREARKIHTVDPFDYFDEPLKSRLLALNPRKAAPLGGKIDYDQPGRAVGNWFREGTNGYNGNNDPRGYWMGHLALVYHHIVPEEVVISIGDFGGRPKQFSVRGNGPDPAQVTTRSGLVKYELIQLQRGSYGQSFPGIRPAVQGVLLVRVLDDRRLQVEIIPGKTADEVAGFSASAVIYER